MRQWGTMIRSVIVRIVAAFLLLLGGVETYACGISDPCVKTGPVSSDGCDQPSGDNCLCCCHHLIPAMAFSLQPCEAAVAMAGLEPISAFPVISLPIDHPPRI